MNSPKGKRPDSEIESALRGRLVMGLGLVGLLAFGIGGWAYGANLTGAVIAPGTVVVDSNVKKVQHPTGGVVGAVMVKNGDRVQAGDVIMRLDETQSRANLGIVVSQLVQLTGRKARLEAERDDSKQVTFPAGFEKTDPEAPAIAAGEKRLFESRLSARNGQKSQLRERVGQLRKEIEGLSAQRGAKETEIKLMREELARVSQMREKELVNVQRLLQTQRDLTRLEGENGVLVAQIAKASGQITEIELQVLGIDQSVQTESGKELREIEARIAELHERRYAAEDQLKRIDIKAPQSGLVHELTANTVGGVIQPGEVVMMIVPSEEALAIEVKISPNDRDQVTTGQAVKLKFPAFNQNTTPEVRGNLQRIAPELTKEQQTGITYFTARVKVAEEQAELVKMLGLVPGMPVEAYVETGQRKAFTYFWRPIQDQIDRAFRESDAPPVEQPKRPVS